MLLGRNQCTHTIRGINWSVSPLADDGRIRKPPGELADMIPYNIERLSLTLDAHHALRNGSGYVLGILSGFLKERRSGGLEVLKFLEFKNSSRIYCNDCDAATRRSRVSYVWNWAVISLQEAVRIEVLLEGYEMEFEQETDEAKEQDDENWKGRAKGLRCFGLISSVKGW